MHCGPRRVELWIIFVVKLRDKSETYSEGFREFYISVLFLSRLYLDTYSSKRAKRSTAVVILTVLTGCLTFMN